MLCLNTVLLAKDFHDTLNPLVLPISIGSVNSYLFRKEQVELTKFLKVSWQPKLIYGRVRRYEKDGKKWAEIAVSDSLNTCWTRFIACKELAHLFAASFEEGPLEQIRSAMEGIFTLADDLPPEKWALVAAIEFLIPWRTRENILGMIQSKKTNYDIALEYRVPERVIDIWRSPSYQTHLAALWVDMDIDHEVIPPQPKP